jgi:hypothetical protein
MSTVIQPGFSNLMRLGTISGALSRRKSNFGSTVNLKQFSSFVFERGGG